MPEVTRINLWGLVNAYLVREPDGLTLIDTTVAPGAKRILAGPGTSSTRSGGSR